MTPELTYLTYAVILLIVHMLIQATASDLSKGIGWALCPQDEQRDPNVVAGRLERALRNYVYNLPAFIALALISRLPTLAPPCDLPRVPTCGSGPVSPTSRPMRPACRLCAPWWFASVIAVDDPLQPTPPSKDRPMTELTILGLVIVTLILATLNLAWATFWAAAKPHRLGHDTRTHRPHFRRAIVLQVVQYVLCPPMPSAASCQWSSNWVLHRPDMALNSPCRPATAIALAGQPLIEDTAWRQHQQHSTALRLYRALNNHFEGLILFTIACVVVTLGENPARSRQHVPVLYLIARIALCPRLRLWPGVPWRSLHLVCHGPLPPLSRCWWPRCYDLHLFSKYKTSGGTVRLQKTGGLRPPTLRT